MTNPTDTKRMNMLSAPQPIAIGMLLYLTMKAEDQTIELSMDSVKAVLDSMGPDGSKLFVFEEESSELARLRVLDEESED